MSESSLFHVLQFVRSIREDFDKQFSPHNSMSDVLRILWGFETDSPEFLRAVASMQDRVIDAINSISVNERVDGEGKEGILSILDQIRRSLAPGSLGSQMQGFYPNLSVTLSQISLAVSVYDLHTSPYTEAKEEIAELIVELEAELERLNKEEYSDIREFARKQIAAIILFLKSVEVFGTESAYTAYFQLALSVRRAKEGKSETEKPVAEKLWPTVERWAGRLAIIEAAVTHSQKLLIAGRQALMLLGGSGEG